jgi:transcriptional adapter 2-alpha
MNKILNINKAKN